MRRPSTQRNLWHKRRDFPVFLPCYLALAVGFLAATWVMVGLKKRLVAAEVRQRDFANRDPLTEVDPRREASAALQDPFR